MIILPPDYVKIDSMCSFDMSLVLHVACTNVVVLWRRLERGRKRFCREDSVANEEF